MKRILLISMMVMMASLLGGCILVDRDHDRGRRDYDDHDHYDHDDHHDYR